jgi:hypothetical protein
MRKLDGLSLIMDNRLTQLTVHAAAKPVFSTRLAEPDPSACPLATIMFCVSKVADTTLTWLFLKPAPGTVFLKTSVIHTNHYRFMITAG